MVSRVHRAIQWRSHPWLEPFADFVSTSRCAADADPNQKILGEMAKLVGNAGFGCFIMDVAVTRRSGTSRMRVKWPVPSTAFSFTIWKN